MTDESRFSESLYTQLYLNLSRSSEFSKLDYATFLLNRVSPILVASGDKVASDFEREIREILLIAPDKAGADKIDLRVAEYLTEDNYDDPPSPLYYFGSYFEMAGSLAAFIQTPSDEQFLIFCQFYEMLIVGAERMLGEDDMWPLDEKEITDHFTKGTNDNTAFTKFAAALASKVAQGT